MQCLRPIRHQHGLMEKYAIVVVWNFRLLKGNIIVGIVGKYFVLNVRLKLVLCPNLESKKRLACHEHAFMFCSNFSLIIMFNGSKFKVRVCDGCFTMLQKPSSGTLKRNEGPNDLPAEYLNSSLAQQSQVSFVD